MVGHVCVGLEDNIYYNAERTELATNAKLIKRILSIANSLEYAPYSHKEAREILGLNNT